MRRIRPRPFAAVLLSYRLSSSGVCVFGPLQISVVVPLGPKRRVFFRDFVFGSIACNRCERAEEEVEGKGERKQNKTKKSKAVQFSAEQCNATHSNKGLEAAQL